MENTYIIKLRIYKICESNERYLLHHYASKAAKISLIEKWAPHTNSSAAP